MRTRTKHGSDNCVRPIRVGERNHTGKCRILPLAVSQEVNAADGIVDVEAGRLPYSYHTDEPAREVYCGLFQPVQVKLALTLPALHIIFPTTAPENPTLSPPATRDTVGFQIRWETT